MELQFAILRLVAQLTAGVLGAAGFHVYAAAACTFVWWILGGIYGHLLNRHMSAHLERAFGTKSRFSPNPYGMILFKQIPQAIIYCGGAYAIGRAARHFLVG